jgi:hypothetical protein
MEGGERNHKPIRGDKGVLENQASLMRGFGFWFLGAGFGDGGFLFLFLEDAAHLLPLGEWGFWGAYGR